MTKVSIAFAVAALAVSVQSARADFAGQTILGPLSNGSIVFGNTTGHTDANDGFSSGIHIFDVWDGGDDVYRLDWTGGDLGLNLTSFGGADLDLFLYTPASYDDSSNYSIAGSFDSVTELGAAAGTYYIVVDCTAFSEGAYKLEVVPAPSAGLIAGIGAIMLGARRRR